MKICIAGIGGVGGYLGGALARKFAGSDEDQVYFVARGARKEAILKDGITVESDLLGTFTAKPFGVGESAEQLGQMDVIFICVKNYSLEAVCDQIRDMVREDTVVVTVMNGVDPAKRAAAYLGKGIVLDSMIYIVAGSRPDFSVKQSGDYCDVHISGREPEAAAKVQALFEDSSIGCHVAEDIEAIIWKKYILNCAFNIVTAYYSTTAGGFRKDPKMQEELMALLKEACSVARKLGVKIADDLEEEHYHHFMVEQSEAATSSLRRDMDAGRPNELETFSGYLLRTAEGLGMELPVSKRFYEGLKAKSAN
ncbi:MAG: 2-dehydropantoate 2-reductase [Firmicutes bacterium]|nr:2-dehydropantoate 2-reductase [Bacillota bacterium]